MPTRGYIHGYLLGYMHKSAAPETKSSYLGNIWGKLKGQAKGQWDNSRLRDTAAKNAAPQWRAWANRPWQDRNPVQSGPEAIRSPEPDMPPETKYFGATTQAELAEARNRLPANRRVARTQPPPSAPSAGGNQFEYKQPPPDVTSQPTRNGQVFAIGADAYKRHSAEGWKNIMKPGQA